MGQDVLEFLGAGDERDLAGGALHGGDQVVGVDRGWGRTAGDEADDLGQGLVHGHAAGQRVQRGVLGGRKGFGDGLELFGGGQEADGGQELGVHAEAGQAGVGDVLEQLRGFVLRLLLRRVGGLEVLDGLFVADLEDAQDAVDAEPVAGGVGFRLILREDRDQAVRVTVGLGGGRQDDAAPAVVDREEADPGVAGVLRPGQVPAGLGVPGEGGDGGVDGELDGLVELRVLA